MGFAAEGFDGGFGGLVGGVALGVRVSVECKWVVFLISCKRRSV